MLGELGVEYLSSRPYHPQTAANSTLPRNLKQHLHAQPPASTIAELQHQLDDAIAHHTGPLASMQDFACARPFSPAQLRRFVGETGYAGGPFSPMKREARGTLFRSGGTRLRKCGSAHDVLNADRIRRRKPYR